MPISGTGRCTSNIGRVFQNIGKEVGKKVGKKRVNKEKKERGKRTKYRTVLKKERTQETEK